MQTYFIVFIILIICWYLYRQPQRSFRFQNFFYWVAVFILLFISGVRYKVGTDYGTYMYNFEWIYTKGDISITNQPALYVIARATELIHHDSALWFFVMAVITIIPIAIVIKKHSIDAMLSIIFFVLIGSWHFSFNIVKQCAAMSILFVGFEYLYNKDLKKWIIICLLATTFHLSALFMLPIYFVVDTNVNKKKIFISFISAIILSLSYDYLLSSFSNLKTEGRISMDSDDVQNSVNLLRVAVNCAPVLFILLFRKVYDFNDKKFVLCFNLSLLNVILNFVAFTSIYLYRIIIYTNVFNVLLIPYIAKPFNKSTRYIIMMVMILLYFIFWTYDLYKGEYTRNYDWIF